jgi:hypothetical protein
MGKDQETPVREPLHHLVGHVLRVEHRAAEHLLRSGPTPPPGRAPSRRARSRRSRSTGRSRRGGPAPRR